MNKKDAQKIIENTPAIVRLRYAGAIGLLCEASTEVSPDVREMIEAAVDDWCELTGFHRKRILDRIEVFLPTE